MPGNGCRTVVGGGQHLLLLQATAFPLFVHVVVLVAAFAEHTLVARLESEVLAAILEEASVAFVRGVTDASNTSPSRSFNASEVFQTHHRSQANRLRTDDHIGVPVWSKRTSENNERISVACHACHGDGRVLIRHRPRQGGPTHARTSQ